MFMLNVDVNTECALILQGVSVKPVWSITMFYWTVKQSAAVLGSKQPGYLQHTLQCLFGNPGTCDIEQY